MEIVLSTKNKSKTEQIKAFFTGLAVSILSLGEAGITGEAVEDGSTLEENAVKKAAFAAAWAKKWAIADDTGLFIDALDGRPGVHAARWAGKNKSTEEIMHYTLEQLKDVPPEARTATFMTVAALVSPDGEPRVFTGSIRGTLLAHPRTACQPNMPYSAIFVPDGQAKVFAEMTVEEGNAIGHRGQAFRQLREFVAQQI